MVGYKVILGALATWGKSNKFQLLRNNQIIYVKKLPMELINFEIKEMPYEVAQNQLKYSSR